MWFHCPIHKVPINILIFDQLFFSKETYNLSTSILMVGTFPRTRSLRDTTHEIKGVFIVVDVVN